MGSETKKDVVRRPALKGESQPVEHLSPKIVGFNGFVTTGAPVFPLMVPAPGTPGVTWHLPITMFNAAGVDNEVIVIASDNAHTIVDTINAGVLAAAGKLQAYIEGTAIALEVPSAAGDYYIQIDPVVGANYNMAHVLGYIVGEAGRVYGGESTYSPPDKTQALSRALNYPGASFVNNGADLSDTTYNRGLSAIARNIDRLDTSLRKPMVEMINLDINLGTSEWQCRDSSGPIDDAGNPNSSLETVADGDGHTQSMRVDKIILESVAIDDGNYADYIKSECRLFVGDMEKVDAADTAQAIEKIAGYYNVLDTDDNEIVVGGQRVSVVAVTEGEATLPAGPNWAAATWQNDTDGLNAGSYGWADEAGTNLLAVNSAKELLAAIPAAGAPYLDRLTLRIDAVYSRSIIRVADPDVGLDGSTYPAIDLRAHGVDIGDIIRIENCGKDTPFNHDGDYYIDKMLPDLISSVDNCLILLRPVNPSDRGELNPESVAGIAPLGTAKVYSGGRFANGVGTGEGVWLYFYPSIPSIFTEFKLQLPVARELRDMPDMSLAAVNARAAEEVDTLVQQIIREIKGPFVDLSDNWQLHPYATDIPTPHGTPAYPGDPLLSLEDIGRRISRGDVYMGMTHLEVPVGDAPTFAAYAGSGGYHTIVLGMGLADELLAADMRDANAPGTGTDSLTNRRAGPGPFAGDINATNLVLESATALFTHFDVGRSVHIDAAADDHYHGRVLKITKYYSSDKVELQGWGGAILAPPTAAPFTFTFYNSAHNTDQGVIRYQNARSSSRLGYSSAQIPEVSQKPSTGNLLVGAAAHEGLPTHSDIVTVPIVSNGTVGGESAPQGEPFAASEPFTRLSGPLYPVDVVIEIETVTGLWGPNTGYQPLWSLTHPKCFYAGDPHWTPAVPNPTELGRSGEFGTTLVEITQATDAEAHGFYLADLIVDPTATGTSTKVRLKTLMGTDPILPTTLTGRLIVHQVVSGSNLPYYSPFHQSSFVMAANYHAADRTYTERGLSSPPLGAIHAINMQNAEIGIEIIDGTPRTESPADRKSKWAIGISMGQGALGGICVHHLGRMYPSYDNEVPIVDTTVPNITRDPARALVGAITSCAHTLDAAAVPTGTRRMMSGAVIGISQDLSELQLLTSGLAPVPDPAGVFLTRKWSKTGDDDSPLSPMGPENFIRIPEWPAGHLGAVVDFGQAADYEDWLRENTVVYAHDSLIRAIDVFKGSYQMFDGEFGIHPALNATTKRPVTHWTDHVASKFGVNSHLLPLSDINMYMPSDTFATVPQYLGGHPYYYAQCDGSDIGDFREGLPDFDPHVDLYAENFSNYLYTKYSWANYSAGILLHVPENDFGDNDFYSHPLGVSTYQLIKGMGTNDIVVRDKDVPANWVPLFTKNCIGMELSACDANTGLWFTATILEVDTSGIIITVGTVVPAAFESTKFVVEAQQWDTAGIRDLFITGRVMSSLVPFLQPYTDVSGDEIYSYPDLGARNRPWRSLYATTWKAPGKDPQHASRFTENKFEGVKEVVSSALNYGQHCWYDISAIGTEPATKKIVTGYILVSDGLGAGDEEEHLMAKHGIRIAGNATMVSGAVADLALYPRPAPTTFSKLMQDQYTKALNTTIATLDLVELLPIGSNVNKIWVSFKARLTNTALVAGVPDANMYRLKLVFTCLRRNAGSPGHTDYYPFLTFNDLEQTLTLDKVNDLANWVSGSVSIDTDIYLNPGDTRYPQFWIGLSQIDALETTAAPGNEEYVGYEVIIDRLYVEYSYKEIGVSHYDKDETDDPHFVDDRVVLP